MFIIDVVVFHWNGYNGAIALEHEKMVDAYSLMSQKLQNSLNENSNYEKTIEELKVWTTSINLTDQDTLNLVKWWNMTLKLIWSKIKVI